MNQLKRKATEQTIKMLPIGKLMIGGYQRPTNTARVNRIVAAFDEAKLGVLIVSARDGQHHLLDGAHRIAALRKMGYTHALCIVLTGLTYQDEAAYFRTQNRDTGPLSQYNLFKSGLEAGDEMCVMIDKICRGNHFIVGTSTTKPNTIVAIYALTTICAVYGYETLDATLATIRATWEGVSNAVRREFLVGVAEFVHRFGTDGFVAQMRFKNIASIWQEYLAETSHTNRQTSDPGMRAAFCRVLVRYYNKGLPSGSKKRLVLEEQAC